jgi:hypothetical protein
MKRQDARCAVDRVYCISEEPEVLGEEVWVVVELLPDGPNCDMLGGGYFGTPVGADVMEAIIWPKLLLTNPR